MLRVSILIPLLAILAGCGSDDPTAPLQTDPPERLFVAPGGSGDGSADAPYGDLEEAVTASGPGDTLSLATGDYDLAEDLQLGWNLTIVGAGMDSTRIAGRILNAAPDSATAVRIARLACDFIGFAVGCPDRPAKLLADSCAVDGVMVSEPYSHVMEFRGCDIEGGIGFSHGGGDGRHVFEECRMRSAAYSHGSGAYHNVLDDCEIEAGIAMTHGDGGTVRVEDCTIGVGISDSSGEVTTIIRNNHFLGGGITDASGGASTPGNPVEDHIVEGNVFDNGFIVSSGASMVIRGNTITVPADTPGILLSTGAPSVINDNVINLPEADLPPGFDWRQPSMTPFVAAIHTTSNAGEIVGNTITGGAIGLYDNSGADPVADNVLTGQKIGVLTIGTGAYRDNTITGCALDGLIFGAGGPIEGNVITGCGGAGLRLIQPADLGGGPDGSAGGNVLRDNAGYDLVIEVDAAADTLYARHNLWDHVDLSEIDALDVWDGKDDPTRATVIVDPVGSER